MAKTTAKHLKGVNNLNPTSAVMKLGSEQQREANARGPRHEDQRGLHHGDSRADSETVGCTECGDMSHPAMQTRHSHPRNVAYIDGRMDTEDHHFAVRQAKGMNK
jgi:hypothetical protein